MRRLIFVSLAFLLFAGGAVAQSSDWRASFDQAYQQARGRSFVEINGTLYAFGYAMRKTNEVFGVYTFLRCGGAGGVTYFSPNNPDHASVLSKLKVVSPGHPDYFRTEAQYDKECGWSLEAWFGKKSQML